MLASMILFGCSQNDELAVEGHKEGDDAYTHVWKDDYSGGDYIRSALQFGAGNTKVTYAKVKVEMKKATDGKAGLLFGLNEREINLGGNTETQTVYDFYAVAFGKNQNATNKIEAYIDYYQGLTTFKDTGDALASEKFGTGEDFVIAATENINFDWDGSTSVTAFIVIDYDDTTKTYDVSIQNNDGTVKFWEKPDISAKNITDTGFDPNLIQNEDVGALYSYGMLSGRINEKSADTTWTIDRDTFVRTGGTFLAADAE